ncbi:MAG: aminotransferase class IV [Clostridia bacterium]|nr:aminotransferase class IV [Clostridia bacterium]
MKNLGYYNGKIGLLEEMQVPMLDRACYFGDGLYDTTAIHNYIPYCLEDHVNRLFRSAERLHFNMPMTSDEVCALVRELCRKLDSGDQVMYLQVSRGTGLRKHPYGDRSFTANIWLMLTPAGPFDTYVKVKLFTVPDTRYFHNDIKTINLLPCVMAAEQARAAGAYEALFYREGGRVTECAHSNIVIIKDGVLRALPLDNLILPGIGRKNAINAAKKLGIPVDETPFYLDDLMNADEIATVGASHFCMQVTHVDEKPVGGKAPDLIRAIQDELTRDFEEKCKF